MQKREQAAFPLTLFSRYRGFLMGLEILMIVAFHYTEDCVKAQKYMIGLIKWYYYNIGSSGVDMFLLLSGMGLYYSWSKHPDYKDFYYKRYTRVLIPYFLVALPAWFCRDIIGGHGLYRLLKDLSLVTFFTEGVIWFWYIFAICFCYLLFPHFYRIFREAASVTEEQIRLLVLAGGWLLFSLMLMECAPDLFDHISIMLVRMPAFIAGVYLGKLSFEKREIAMPKVILFCLILLFCQVGLHTNRITLLSRFSLAGFNLMLCIWLLLLLSRIDSLRPALSRPFLRFFEVAGKYSLEIYLIHVAVRRLMSSIRMADLLSEI